MIFYTTALACHLLSWKKAALCIFIMGLLLNGGSLGLRYWTFFPLLPLHQGPFFLPFAIGVIGLPLYIRKPDRLCFLILATGISWAAFLCPNDFYLPFLQFKTIFAHGLFVGGVIGKALFLLSGEAALFILLKGARPVHVKQMGQFLLWGFFFWTLSVFSGAVWSWLGWGAPLVWDDPVIAISMATWLLSALLLHLHLTRFSTPSARAGFILAAAVWVICFCVIPELGPFRMPGWLK